MSTHRLIISADSTDPSDLSADDFLWRPRTVGLSTFQTSLSPDLREMGLVPDLHVDFVRIAAMTFFCDRTVRRPRMLLREMDLTVPVSDPERWTTESPRLAALLGLLTGDDWSFSFEQAEPIELVARPEQQRNGDIVLLYSGGADSQAGTLHALASGRVPILASHFDWGQIHSQQHAAKTALYAATGADDLSHETWHFARVGDAQKGSGETLGDEASRRSRSMLFFAFGLALAAPRELPMWVAENGFTSINPPMSPERRASNATRTTHPSLLQGLAEMLGDLGMHKTIVNPFGDITKGEAFSLAAGDLNPATVSSALSATNSCAKPNQNQKGFAPDTHCGICMGCLVRRGAFVASGIADGTTYLERALGTIERDTWLAQGQRRSHRASVEYRVAAGFEEDDIYDLALPDDYDLDAALDLAQRGLLEVAAIKIP
jgi:7-cyano-7-deazaguanine synthase in queuosine biosynthesis